MTRPAPPSVPGAAIPPVLAVLALAACATVAWPEPATAPSYYRASFPGPDHSRYLETAFASMQRLSTTATYTTYVFTEDAGVTDRDVLDDDPFRRERTLARAIDVLSDTETKAGSAAVIGHADRRVALITNDHVTRFPAVRIEHYGDPRGRARSGAQRVASVSFRTLEHGMLVDHPELGGYDVLVRDSINDLAVVEVRLDRRRDAERFPVMPLPPGDPTRLRWGSFVYALGYPLGYRMVTRGIVSDPDRDGVGGFVTDAIWNEGISGGVILAVREDTGALEWVGLTRAGAGRFELRLHPRVDEDLDEPWTRLHDGPVYAENALRLRYGITLPVAMTTIRAFLTRHRAVLRRAGYDLSRF